MKWHDGFVAIRVHSDEGEEVVHTATREDLRLYLARVEQQKRTPHKRIWSGGMAETHCGYVLDLSNLDAYSEATEAEINCDACVADIEAFQAKVPDMLRALKEWTAYKREERERRRQIEGDFARTNKLLQECKRMERCYPYLGEPFSALELPDELSSRLAAFGSIGEVMLFFVFEDDEAYRELLTALGQREVAMLRSALLTKGYFRPEDMVW